MAHEILIHVAVTIPVQDASPVASETSIFPTHGEPPVILTCHATSSLVTGLAVQIPTLPVDVTLIR